jgi:quercetin dioxygenase-like cupin family protein
MPIRVYDYRTDIKNLEVHPEIRARFLRIEPGPPDIPHSHDVGGEIFLVMDGQCEFLVDDERVTCSPGQLIYVEPRRRHTLRAVGDKPCVVYLSVTPHVEPTHTLYDAAGTQLPPQYATWRGPEDGDTDPDIATVDVATRYARALRRLAEAVQDHDGDLNRRLGALTSASGTEATGLAKQQVDDLWPGLRAVLEAVSGVESAWNALAPRVMP